MDPNVFLILVARIRFEEVSSSALLCSLRADSRSCFNFTFKWMQDHHFNMKQPPIAERCTTTKHQAHGVHLPGARSIRVVHVQPAASPEGPIDCELTITL